MRTKPCTLAIGAVLLLIAAGVGGCIVSDQLTTLTIQPDGSADLLLFTSNVHSNEKGVKADEELRNYVADFNAGKDADQARVAAAGGQIVEARWIRDEVPLVNLVRAKLPTAAALERLFTFKREDGTTAVQARFAAAGQRRTLSFHVALAADEQQQANSGPPTDDARQAMANGISETRFAVAGGTIVEARGFVVATDKQSALLDTRQIDELLRHATGPFELFLTWELAEK